MTLKEAVAEYNKKTGKHVIIEESTVSGKRQIYINDNGDNMHVKLIYDDNKLCAYVYNLESAYSIIRALLYGEDDVQQYLLC